MRITSRLLTCLVLLVVLLFAANSYAHHAQYYVLDGFGGVHAGGGAAAPPAGIPYFGFDIAKDIAYVPAGTGLVGDGLLVLDGFGGVHSAGLGAVLPATPYFGFDVARAITYRNIPPRAAGTNGTSSVDIAVVGANQVLQSVSITAPDDGWIFVVGTSYISCLEFNTPTELSAILQVNIDSTADSIANMGIATWDTCADGGGRLGTQNQTVTNLFPATPGAHTVNLLARKTGGAGTARYLGRSLTAIFIDHDGVGTSLPVVDPNVENASRSIGR